MENGPTIEGRLPPRSTAPFEAGYEFSPQKMGYRKCTDSHVLSFNVPGTYQVYSWIESEKGEVLSRSQFCVFEIVLPAATMGA